MLGNLIMFEMSAVPEPHTSVCAEVPSHSRAVLPWDAASGAGSSGWVGSRGTLRVGPIAPPPPARRRAVVIVGALWVLLLLVTRALELVVPVTAPSFRS